MSASCTMSRTWASCPTAAAGPWAAPWHTAPRLRQQQQQQQRGTVRAQRRAVAVVSNSSSSGGGGGGGGRGISGGSSGRGRTGALPKPAAEPFRWREQWYALGFAEDFEVGLPTRVYLFDEPLVVLRRPGGLPPVVMADRCPHRAAALSEGLMTPAGNLQCAYHGWEFDGRSGECVGIPQVRRAEVLTGRTCGVAYPVLEKQGMLFVYPVQGATPDEAAIPGVPELDDPRFVALDFVRDMPVDCTVLIENVLDPDHGPFAHQLAAFDLYAASAQQPLAITAQASSAAAFEVTAEVPALPKTFAIKEGTSGGIAPAASDAATSVTRFRAPGHIVMCRREPSGETRSMTVFYFLPAGFGRTRFMIRHVRSFATWLRPPRWLAALMVNAFLDQDTYLIATQQEVTLAMEVNNRLHGTGGGVSGGGGASGDSEGGNGASGAATDEQQQQQHAPTTRRQLYCHRSPTDNLLVVVGRWLDANVPRMPNRYARVAAAASGANATTPATFAQPREVVLDRWADHTVVSPPSMRAYKAANAVCAIASGAALLCVQGAVAAAAVAAGAAAGPATAAAAVALLAGGAAFGAAAYLAWAFAAQFRYVHTRARQAKEQGRITSHIMPKRIAASQPTAVRPTDAAGAVAAAVAVEAPGAGGEGKRGVPSPSAVVLPPNKDVEKTF